MRRILYLALACALPMLGRAQNNSADDGLREFVNSPTGINGLQAGGATYVKNAANGIEPEVLYDYPNGTSATLVSSDGKEFPTKARYWRELGRVEIWYGGRNYFADGEVFPYVVIGEHVYAYNDYGSAKTPKRAYAKLVAGTSETDYQVARLFTITRRSDVPPDRGFSRAQQKTYRVDSTDVLIGDRPFALEVHRRAGRFRGYLSACGAGAHEEAVAQTRYRTVAYYDRLIEELQEGCAGER